MLRIGIIADWQCSDMADQYFALGGGEYRRFETSWDRLDEIIASMNSEGVDLVVDCGDLVDQASVTEDLAILQAAVLGGGYALSGQGYSLSDLNMDIITVPGNHEVSKFGGSESDYYTVIDNIHATRANEYAPESTWKHYTYDIGGYRFICVSGTTGFDTEQRAGDTWLASRISEAESAGIPVIIVSHGAWWDASNTTPSFKYYCTHESSPGWKTMNRGTFLVYDSDERAFMRNILENSSVVNAAFCGHNHVGNQDIFVNSFRCYNFWGSVFAPETDDNAWYIMELTPNVIKTVDGWRSDIRLIGMGSRGKAKSHSRKSLIAV